MSKHDFLIIGSGIYGISTALALHARGHDVAIMDPGPIPHPLAASTDISKVVRMEYGLDEQYTLMVDSAIDGWHAWNERFDDTLYHEVGMAQCTRNPLQPGDFELDSIMMLEQHGFKPERLSSDEIARRWPAWNALEYVDGFFHARAGFVESGRVVSTLASHAREVGVAVYEFQTADEITRVNGRVTGVTTREGERFDAGHVIVCAGSFTPYLVPELQPYMVATGHPVFHVRPRDPSLFTPPNLSVFGADVTHGGWYGFPFHPHERVVKIANHGPGLRLHPERDDRVVTDMDIVAFRKFLAGTFPALVDAPITFTRRCVYNDTLDEHFWIDRHPEIEGLTVGAGGSGHGFKFGPVLGDLIADAAVGESNEWLPKFRWRDLAANTHGEEASRFHGE